MKTELFRFATLRKPNLIEPTSKQIGFVQNIQADESFFLKKLKTKQNLEEAKSELVKIAAQFSKLVKKADVISVNKEMYDFSGWLLKNRSSLNYQETLDTVKSLKALNAKERTILWDNLYAEQVLKQSAPIRQACIHMLLADHFVANYNSEQLQGVFSKGIGQKNKEGEELILAYWRRLAHASLSLHYVFAGVKQNVKPNKSGQRRPNELIQDQDRFVSEITIDKLKLIANDLGNLNQSFEIEQRLEVHKAEEKHVTKVENDLSSYKKINKLDRLNISDLKKINVDSLPELSISEPEIKLIDPFQESYFKGKVDSQTSDFLKKNRTNGKNLSGLKKEVETRIQQENKKLNSKLKSTKRRVKLAGKSYGIERKLDGNFSITFREVEEGAQKFEVYLTYALSKEKVFVKNCKYSLTIPSLGEKKSANFQEVKRNKRAVFLRLFPKIELSTTSASFFEFKGTLELSNGAKIELELDGQVGSENWNISKGVTESESESITLAFEKGDVYGVNRIGIADYRVVEQEVCCYVPGEVSHIENVMAREYKERHTRSLTRSETSTETENVYEAESQTDTSTTERSELNTEIAAVIEAERSNAANVSTGVSGTIYGVEMSVDAGIDFASFNSSSDSNTLAKNYAIDVMKAATERVLQKTTQKRISKIIKEYEENNRHGFDNRAGDEHVTGVYRWVDKVMTNRLVNYGKRLVYEFMIPEPSKFYRMAIEIKADTEEVVTDAVVVEEPIHPSELDTPILSAMDITRDNYSSIAACYGASVSAPPEPTSSVSESYSSPSLDKKEFSQTLMPPILVPEDYVAVRTTGTLTYDWEAKPPINDGGAFINISFGGKSYTSGKKEGSRTRTTIPTTYLNIWTGEYETVPGLTFNHGDKTGSLTGSVNGNKLFSYNISLNVEMELKPQVFEQWQIETYEAILSAYNQLKEAYDARISQDEAMSEDESTTMNVASSMYRQIEQREIKRLAIELMTAPFNLDQGKDFTGDGECGIPKIIQNSNWETYSSQAKFFEQAFDWSIMSYLFYPYYWAGKCDWIELFQAQTGTDETFDAFLQSGMARVTVPVRQGFEKAVSYFMATGEVWMGGDLVLDTDDDLYLSIAEELEVIEGQVEEEWETTLPTTLTIVQKDSASLTDGALPCCNSDSDGRIEVSTSKMEAKKEN